MRNSRLFKEVNKPEVVKVRFGQMLDELKRSRGVTGEEFAKAVGISRSLVYMIRRGANSLTMETATKIEKAYPEYTAAWLLGLVGDKATDKIDALRVLNKNVEKMTPEQREMLLNYVQYLIESELLKIGIR